MPGGRGPHGLSCLLRAGGPEHPTTALVRNNLAALCDPQGVSAGGFHGLPFPGMTRGLAIEDGKVVAYRTKVKVSFKYEGKD